MSVPAATSDALAVIMLAIAAYCAIRPAAARRWRRTTERDSDAAHVLMGLAMAAVLVPRLNPVRTGVWAIALAAACGWFAARVLLDQRARLASARRAGPATSAGSAGPTPNRPGACSGHHLVHLLSCGSTLYMLLGASSAAAMTSMPASPAAGASLVTGAAVSPLIAFALALAMAGSVVVTTDRMTVLAPARLARPTNTAQSPGTAQSPSTAQSTGTGQQARTADQPALSGAWKHSGQAVLCPRLATTCQIVMGVTMVYMLVLML